MQNIFFCDYIFLFCTQSQIPGTQVWVFSDQVRVELQINLQLTGKISLKLDTNSSLLLEYGR